MAVYQGEYHEHQDGRTEGLHHQGLCRGDQGSGGFVCAEYGRVWEVLPNTIADSWLPGSPLTSPWTASNSVMKEPNSHSMVSPPRTPPIIWDIQ